MIYIFNACTTVHNTDGLDSTIWIVLNKFVAFSMRIFMKFINIQQHHVQTTYIYITSTVSIFMKFIIKK